VICRKPIIIGALPVGCGQCIPCRVNRRRVWAHRIVLEAKEHPQNAFVTLTYNEENLPRTRDGIPTLRPDDLTLWLKRFRKRSESIAFATSRVENMGRTCRGIMVVLTITLSSSIGLVACAVVQTGPAPATLASPSLTLGATGLSIQEKSTSKLPNTSQATSPRKSVSKMPPKELRVSRECLGTAELDSMRYPKLPRP